MSPQARALRRDINVTPLVDIVLVLLIVFIVMVPVLTRKHDAALPREGEGAAPGAPLVLTVLKGGGLKLQREPLEAEALVARLAEALRRQPADGRKVFVKVDGDQPFQRTVDALDLVRRASDKVKREGDPDAVAAVSLAKDS
ncbi:MAG: biopolymer transporter ExbD [Holophagaceae bacterium]